MNAPSEDLDAWAADHVYEDPRVEATGLFQLAQAAHGHAMRDLLRTERALIFAIRRAQRSRRHAERAGRLLVNAIKLVEMTRCAR